jgi:GTP-binding protein
MAQYGAQKLMLRRNFSQLFRFRFRSSSSSSSVGEVLDYSHVRVAVVGRPNVGKSTLFNRLVGRNMALCSAEPGLTRDRLEAVGNIYDLKFTVIDTAGLEEILVKSQRSRFIEDLATGKSELFGNAQSVEDKKKMCEDMMLQTSLAIQSSDIVLMMVDGSLGITPLDEHFAHWIRKHIKKNILGKSRILLVANKCESMRREIALSPMESSGSWSDVYSLGLGEPIMISAERREGFHTLYHNLLESMKEIPPKEKQEQETDHDVLHLAIVGRPNTGKSSLINRLLESDRLLTGPMPGVTRDSVSVNLQFRDRPVRLVDTAGLVGTSSMKIKESNDSDAMAMARSLKAINFSNVVGLTMDSTNLFRFDGNLIELQVPRREKSIASLVLKEGRALMLLLTKWDLVPENLRPKALEKVREYVDEVFLDAKGVQVLPISSNLENMINMKKVLPVAFKTHHNWNIRISTGLLNAWLSEMKRFTFPGNGPVDGSRKNRKNSAPKIKYITQIKSRPPTFAFFGSMKGVTEEHPFVKKLVSSLRKEFHLDGVPIRILLRNQESPFAKGIKKPNSGKPKKNMSRFSSRFKKKCSAEIA